MNRLAIRFRQDGQEKPGVLLDGQLYDVSAQVADWSGERLADLREQLAGLDLDNLPTLPADTPLACPVGGVRKMLAIGLNYAGHLEEMKAQRREDPMLFSKAITALSGPHDPIVIPAGAQAVDWEVELVVVIGRGGVRIPREQALAHVAGYCTGIDVSERHWQKQRGGQFIKGKSADSFGPVGPWLVPAERVDLQQGLDLQLSVNGQVKQRSNTRLMLHDVPALIAHVSTFLRLEPGDLLFTGTPDGVGMGRTPEEYLQPGDEVVARIAGLGEQRHRVLAEPI